MKVNLRKMAAELARDDEPARLNVSVVQASAVLGALGRRWRPVVNQTINSGVAWDECCAIKNRAGLCKPSK
jgi:hypothetical protein